MNGRKHSSNFIYSQFLHECNFELLLSFPTICILLTVFKDFWQLSPYYDFVPYYGNEMCI